MISKLNRSYKQQELLHEPSADNLWHSVTISSTTAGSATIELIDVAERYAVWPKPTVIVSDGAYGVNGFPGDPATPAGLAAWYAPHIASWALYALPETTLWFWGTEIGWATVHPILELHGWDYRGLHIWDKSVAHVAGNVNSKTIRSFPVVTEVCARYVRDVKLPTDDGQHLPIQQWLRREWLRAGLPLSKTNEACGVKNAATRKYFTQDHLWYFPPPEMIERLAHYASQHGYPTHWPYFSIDGKTPISAEQWSRLRAKWHHIHGVTNVWTEHAVRGTERLKNENAKCIHANQKPLRLIERLILASSDPGDIIWEPFGGLCSVAVASLHTGRQCYSAEVLPDYYKLAKARVEREEKMLVRARTA